MQEKVFIVSADLYPQVQRWLSENSRWKKASQYKRFEDDLRGERNPNRLLDELFLQERRFPSILEFQREYYLRHRGWLESLFRADLTLKWDVRARLYRVTAGYVAELNAASLVACYAPEGSLVYKGYPLDARGVDFLWVLPNGRRVGFHVFVDTCRGRYYRQLKRLVKRSDGLPMVHVDLPYSLDANAPNGLVYYPSGFGRLREDYVELVVRRLLDRIG